MWGSIHAGSVANAIPGTGEIVGTLRALDVAGWQRAKQLIPELAADIVRPFGVEVEVSVTDGVPPAVNHASRHPPADPGQPSEMLGPHGGRGDRAVAGRGGLLLDAAAGAGRAGPARRPYARDGRVQTSTSRRSRVDEACIGVGLKVLAERGHLR